MMEAESAFLSTDEKRGNAFNVLNKVLLDLNRSKMTTIIEGETTIHLKIVDHFDDPPAISNHMVPLFNDNFFQNTVDAWDLTTQQIAPYVNGINHISRIAYDSDVEISLVRACVQNLVYYQVAEVVPIFKYSNVYICTRNLQKLSLDKDLVRVCRFGILFNTSSIPKIK